MGFAAVGTPSELALAFSLSPRSLTSGGASSASSASIGVTLTRRRSFDSRRIITAVRSDGSAGGPLLSTCKNCKGQFDPLLNHAMACRFHTAHFGGETKRKFESVYSGGTMDTPDSGRVFQYWHCCGSEDPFDPGCTAAPHSSYDE